MAGISLPTPKLRLGPFRGSHAHLRRGEAEAMVSHNGLHIAVEGSDGAGKSTLIHNLMNRLEREGREAILVNKHYQGDTTGRPHSITPDLLKRFAELQPVTYGPFPEGRNLWGDHHWLFILGAWYSLLDTVVIHPALEQGLTVVVDNPHYKTLARYLLKADFPVETAWHVFSHLRVPDLVAYLDIDPRVALTRKGGFEAIETGFRGGDRSDFLDHQRELSSVLRTFAARWGWKGVDTSEISPDQVLDQVWTWVNLRLPDQAGPTSPVRPVRRPTQTPGPHGSGPNLTDGKEGLK